MKINKILILAPEYPADDLPKTTTPVVHLFCKEWKKMGVDVMVINPISNFPSLYYLLSKPFVNYISSKEGFQIRTHKASAREYIMDDVCIKRIPMAKTLPHTRYNHSEIANVSSQILEYCNSKYFIPDFIVGHWFNPTVEIINELRKKWHVKAGVVLHGDGSGLLKRYGNSLYTLMESIDIIGCRSFPIKSKFESLYNFNLPTFVCPSGISENYISNCSERVFTKPIESFIFVGTLIKRKYPAEMVPAISRAFPDRNFEIKYIGKGIEEKNVIRYGKIYGVSNNIKLLGRKSKDEVINVLKETDVLVMNSKDEAFGLVYLEAMAVGCIVIASKNEGFDGIIQDGVNGFLCNAGDIDDLSSTIKRIKRLSIDDINRISNAAIETAKDLTERKVAARYLSNLESVI